MTRTELETRWAPMVKGVCAIAGNVWSLDLPVPDWLHELRDEVTLLSLSDEDEADLAVSSGVIPAEYARDLASRLEPHVARLWEGVARGDDGCMAVLFAYDVVYRVVHGERLLDEGVR
jgi:hypothetical protein